MDKCFNVTFREIETPLSSQSVALDQSDVVKDLGMLKKTRIFIGRLTWMFFLQIEDQV